MRMAVETPSSLRFVDLLRPLRAPANDLENAIYREQQQQIVAMGLAMGAVMAASGLLVSMVFWSHVPLWKIGAWYVPIASYSLFMAYTWKRYKGSLPPERVSGYFLRMGDRGAVMIGAVFGASLFIFETDYAYGPMFLAMVLSGMSAGIASLLNSVPRLVTRFIFASTLPFVVKTALTGTSMSFAISSLTLTLMLALIVGSMRNYSNLARLLMTMKVARSAKQGLVDAIEATRDAFVIYDDADKVITANASYREIFPHGDQAVAETNDTLRQVGGRWLMQSSRPTAQGGRVIVHTDVTTLKHRERELITAQREAEDADQAKTRFISTMSHELRTPLNIILGFSKLMTEDSNIKLTDDDIREYAANIHESGDDLLSLINDIIDYSKIGLDKYLLDREEVELKEVLVRVASLACSHAGNASVADIHISIAPDMGNLIVDEVAFRRIMVNLISNALKFRTDDPRVIVRAGLHGDGQPFIAVRDFGAGMTEDQCKRAFEAFYQGDPDLSRKQGGTGLGLTLSRHLAKLHDGDVLLKSRAGIGTTAMLVLPAEAHTKVRSDVPASDAQDAA